ncbi:MAG: DUF3073 domain-containing protein [Candidatus Nanopelagicales bacterium]
MGRGRAKAKQTKVARQLKYGGPATDLEKLQAELAGVSVGDEQYDESDEEWDDDLYSKYAGEDEDDEDEADDEDAPDDERR